MPRSLKPLSAVAVALHSPLPCRLLLLPGLGCFTSCSRISHLTPPSLLCLCPCSPRLALGAVRSVMPSDAALVSCAQGPTLAELSSGTRGAPRVRLEGAPNPLRWQSHSRTRIPRMCTPCSFHRPPRCRRCRLVSRCLCKLLIPTRRRCCLRSWSSVGTWPKPYSADDAKRSSQALGMSAFTLDTRHYTG
jgi:hypothetical protein